MSLTALLALLAAISVAPGVEVLANGNVHADAGDIDTILARTTSTNGPGADSEARQGFAEWEIPIPEGTPVLEYPPVSMAERAGRFVRAEPDLVVGGDSADLNSLFYRATRVAVDSSGRMYVADVGNHRIQVFDEEGSFVRSLGRRGQGPGELEIPQQITVAAGKVYVWDTRKRRFLTWALDGSLGPQVSMPSVSSVKEAGALADGTLVLVHGRFTVPHGGGPPEAWSKMAYLVQAFGLNGEPGRIFLELESIFPTTSWSPYPAHAVDPNGVVYISTAGEYQILAVDAASGVAKWALRVDMPRRSVEERIRRRTENLKKEDPDWTPTNTDRLAEELNASGYVDAVRKLWVDGHGHLYVALDRTREDLEAGSLGGPSRAIHAIDVYSREGERLFSGFLDNDGWTASQGDYVYDRESDPETLEAILVRFVLKEPFD